MVLGDPSLVSGLRVVVGDLPLASELWVVIGDLSVVSGLCAGLGNPVVSGFCVVQSDFTVVS